MHCDCSAPAKPSSDSGGEVESGRSTSLQIVTKCEDPELALGLNHSGMNDDIRMHFIGIEALRHE